MSRTGPPPKDPSTRARRNKDVVQLRVVDATPVRRPELPNFTVQVTIDGELVTQEFVWPEMTRQWWAALDQHPLAREFIEADWSYLMETARVHAAFWLGDVRVAGELRMRESKYGFTPEDRIKLRISLAVATEAETRVAERQERRQAVSRPKDDPRLKLA